MLMAIAKNLRKAQSFSATHQSYLCMKCFHNTLAPVLNALLIDKREQLAFMSAALAKQHSLLEKNGSVEAHVTKEDIEYLKAEIEKITGLVKDSKRMVDIVLLQGHHKDCPIKDGAIK